MIIAVSINLIEWEKDINHFYFNARNFLDSCLFAPVYL